MVNEGQTRQEGMDGDRETDVNGWTELQWLGTHHKMMLESFKKCLNISCLGVFACSVYHMHSWLPQRTKEGVRSCGTQISGHVGAGN